MNRVNRAVGGAITAVFITAALLSVVWTPYDIVRIDIAHRLAPPSWQHWIGTDPLGRDILSLLMAGARNSLLVGLLSTAFSAAIGIAFGLAAAAWRGWVEGLVMRLGDVLFAFPALVLAILIASVLGAGLSTTALAIGLFNIPVFARLTRAEALRHWNEPYILAARLAGKGRARISLEHILPQLRGVLVTQGLIQVSFSVAAEAGLSYVGLGILPPAASWGRMIADGQSLILQAPWQSLSPCAAILLLVMGLNRLAEGARR